MQLAEHALAATPLFVRERKPHVVGTYVQRPKVLRQPQRKRRFSRADCAGDRNRDQETGTLRAAYKSRRVAGRSGIAPVLSGLASSD